MRFASYNVHSGVGVDGKTDTRRQLHVLRELNADVIGLQEVLNIDRGGISLLDSWAGALSMQMYFEPTDFRQGVAYGNAILSRFPKHRCVKHDASVDGREPRIVLDALLETPYEFVQVINTHFGLRRHERRKQAERIIELTGRARAPLQIVMGDFNEWQPRGRTVEMLDRHFGHRARHKTFPSPLPVFALDRIWVNPNQRLESIQTWRSPLASRASDHCPIYADTIDE